MFYTVYRITNVINNKTYIGKHKTNNLDDGYMGSGKLIRRAIEKHGIENFKKEILFVFDNEDEMNAKEKELVNEEYLSSGMTYNLCPGGKGGFGYINEKRLWDNENHKSAAQKNARIAGKRLSEYFQSNSVFIEKESKRRSLVAKRRYKENGSWWNGREHKEETKRKISEANKISQKGKRNSQYGTCWITNGFENKKIKKENLDNWIELGYKRGRI